MKKNLASTTRSSFKAKIAKYLLEDEVIMNWSVLNKSILILILGSLVHIFWIFWKSFVLLSPNLWNFVDLALLQLQLKLDILFFCLLILMILPCVFWSKKKWAQQWLPYLSIGILVLSLCRNGAMIGVLSPATMVSYVSLVTVGLVLFNRKIVYFSLIPVTLFLVLSNYLSLEGHISYAPLFHLNTSPYQNKFWVSSMLYFIAPILMICLILFEILLSQWRHREQLIQHLSQIDPLTNILNRRSIKACLEKLEHRPIKSYALVLIDLDHFKQINDQYGHNTGDETLIQVSEALSKIIRDQDVVGRFGGEEFILILHQSSLAQAKIIAERCRQAIQALHLLSSVGDSIQVTASFGVAFSSTEIDPQKLLSQADKALYEAKACGRNQVKCYPENLGEAQLY